ncbi:acyl-CoA dehydrogenase family protein [Bradyrhizobium sp. Gha]|uniref:acyl-CoA dehydrogenase family protein n=1 Tax=Bradyrhizobium sp. Gha TaxID=1855318 RepID=UPI0015A5950B|nr:acyl-CoA dehydrogenase family protein [Bradyrhizobium sp. Gha]
MLSETVRRFATEELRPKLREFEARRSVARDVQERFESLGLAAIDLPEALGGVGLGLSSRVLVNRILAEADAGAALALDRFGPAAYVIETFGGSDLLERYRDLLASRPETRLALLIDVDAGTVLEGPVRGEAAWIASGNADVLVCLRRDGAWVMESGFELEQARGAALHATGASRIRYGGAPAHVWRDSTLAAQAWAKVRLYHAALIWGVLVDAAGFSRRYALERVAFGKPIAHHQALAFLIVDMEIAVERVGLLIADAARLIDAGMDGTGAAASAFVDAVEASRFVGPNAVQILGGHGFMRDYPVEKAMRDSRALGLLAGGTDAAQDDAGAALAPANPMEFAA